MLSDGLMWDCQLDKYVEWNTTTVFGRVKKVKCLLLLYAKYSMGISIEQGSVLPTRWKNPLNKGFFKQNIHIEGKGGFFVKFTSIKRKLLFNMCTSYFIPNLNQNPSPIDYLRYVILFWNLMQQWMVVSQRIQFLCVCRFVSWCPLILIVRC